HRDGLADGPPEVLRPVQGALEPGAAHLQRVRSEAIEIVERGLDALRRRRDGVEVDAAVAVDDDADRAGAARARELPVEKFQAERRGHGLAGGADGPSPRPGLSPPSSLRSWRPLARPRRPRSALRCPPPTNKKRGLAPTSRLPVGGRQSRPNPVSITGSGSW